MKVSSVVAPTVTIEKKAAADESVVLAVHEQRGQELFGFARRLGLTDDQASDAVQETMLRMWKALCQGEVIERPDAWAFRAIYRLAMDSHRWRRRFERLIPRLSAEPRSMVALEPSDRVAVWAEVDLLPSRQRDVLYLRYRADLRFEDVGLALGISASAARSHCAAALATLRRRFGPDHDVSETERRTDRVEH